MSKPLMSCGCWTGLTKPDGRPVCLTHNTDVVAAEVLDLTGRMAHCSCGKSVPSSTDLAFFEYQGPGSGYARITCICKYHDVAHSKETNPHWTPESFAKDKCKGVFTPIGPAATDRYYCGCYGWD